jgi:hypothetical protein
MRGILQRSSPEIKAGVHIGLFWLFHLQLDDFCAGVGVIKLIVCVLLKDKTFTVGSWRLVSIYFGVMLKTKDSFKSPYVQSSLYVHTDDCNWYGWLIFLGWPLQYALANGPEAVTGFRGLPLKLKMFAEIGKHLFCLNSMWRLLYLCVSLFGALPLYCWPYFKGTK